MNDDDGYNIIDGRVLEMSVYSLLVHYGDCLVPGTAGPSTSSTSLSTS